MFETTESKVYDAYKLFLQVDRLAAGLAANEESEEYALVEKEFKEAMDNDFNSAVAIANTYAYLATIQKSLAQKNYQKALNLKGAMVKFYSVLNLLQQNAEKVDNDIKENYVRKYNINKNEIEELINKRLELKAEKRYQEADEIRAVLTQKKVVIKDVPGGTEWDIVVS